MMRTKFIPILIVASQLAACTLFPGQHMQQFSKESSTEFPVIEYGKAAKKKLPIKLITAQTIIDLESDAKKNSSLGAENAANLYFDYRIGSNAVKGPPPKEHYRQYLVGPRDVLTITVWEHPELTIPAGEFRTADTAGNTVGEDGTIFFPYAGIVKAAGRTVEEIRAELTQKLSRYIEQVQLDVRVSAYKSQRVYVVGAVVNPGVQMLRDVPLTVLEAINGAGIVNGAGSGAIADTGLGIAPDLRNVTLTRDGKPYKINVLSIYEGGDMSQNVQLKHLDVLNVPDSQFNKIFVLGETTSAGTGQGRSRSVLMNKGRMTLTEAISESGGPNQELANADHIFVFRGGMGKPGIFILDAKSPDALILADRFPMEPRDIIFVDRVEGFRWNQIINQIQPTVSLLNVFEGSMYYNNINGL